MKKYILLSFVFVLGLLIFNVNSLEAQSYIPSCSSVSGYSLVKNQSSCSVATGTSAVFNFKASDPDNDNLSWSINWGDTKGLPKICPSFFPNNTISISHAWATTGTYNVKVGVSDCKGGDTEANFNVVVKNDTSTPSADFTDIVVSSQNLPDKSLWFNTIAFPLKFIVNGTSVPDFTYSLSTPDSRATWEKEWKNLPNYPAPFLWQIGENKKNFGFSPSKCGPQDIKIVFNSDKKIPEKDYTNNTFEKTIMVDCTTPPYDFDMTIEKVGTWPTTTTTQGERVTFYVNYYNKGTQEDVRFSYLNAPVCLYRTDSTGTHKQCPARSFSYQDRPICGNNHYVLKVDAHNNVLETNENNNEVSGDVFLDCSKKPDFIIEKVGIWPTIVKSGTKPVMRFVQKNIGQISASTGVARMTVNGEYQAGAWYSGNLSVGSSTDPRLFGYQRWGSQQSERDWWIPVCSKGDKFTLGIGVGETEIEELNKSNNILIHEVTCE